MIARHILDELAAVVGRQNVLCAETLLHVYEYDAYMLESARPEAVVFARSTEDVASVAKVAYREGLPLIPRGSATNLSGGTQAVRGGIVIELARMNRVLEIDTTNRTVLVEAGVFNADVSLAVDQLGFYYAPDPASGKACTIGGNLAEGAGGPHCFKYGVTANHVLGAEVVLADGEVVWLGGKSSGPAGKSPDHLGYDLLGAFIGSEGTLGICTKALLRMLRKPPAVKTLLAVFDSLETASSAVSSIVRAGIVPATLEMMDHLTIEAIEGSMAAGYPRDAAAVLLVELDGLPEGMAEMAESIVAICRECGARETRIAQSEQEREALWRGRKGAFGAVARLAPNYLVADATVPRTKLPETLLRVGEIAEAFGLRVCNVFHAGDGNLHPLLLFDSRDADQVRRVSQAAMEIMRTCVAVGGTITGEHGIGIEKIAAMSLVFGAEELAVQRSLKQAFDPAGIVNPGKVLPPVSAGSVSESKMLPPKGRWRG
jgi:glycolate oxidase